ncbi:MAG: peptidoglycan DD-metalloendopeptidase family protein [Chromatiales bacterium]|nr:peptidoglycan DD-metalloendopeptidase family protein [Chromatiales bacterium]
MKVIVLSKLCHKTGSRSFSIASLAGALFIMLAAVAGGSLWLGYELGRGEGDIAAEPDQSDAVLESLLKEQQALLDDTRQTTQEHLDALAIQLGEMQSSIMRLDALGERLTEVAELDTEEFDFSAPPARGGIETPEGIESVELSELLAEMSQLSKALDDREQKFDLLANLMASSKVQDDMVPRGRPVAKGWISSRYGTRKDPFTGKKAFHHGVDIAGKKNSEVTAVASGLVIWAGKKSDFGYLVEIKHADGYTTKYAHNSKIFVKAGDLVKRGDVVALMGSSGRSTGPHLHFEVARNGKTINPIKVLKKK